MTKIRLLVSLLLFVLAITIRCSSNKPNQEVREDNQDQEEQIESKQKYPLVEILKGMKKITVGHNVAGYPVTSGIGNRRHPIHGTISYHNGVDIGTPTGTPLYAPWDLQVRKVVNKACGLGFVATLPSNPDIRFGACHLSWLNPGKQVKAGVLFARTGNSGGSTNPHLHINQRIIVEGEGYWTTPRHAIITPFLTGEKGPLLPRNRQ